VALIEDKRAIRESWRKLIDSFPDFSCVCTCASGEEAQRLLPSIAPDVVLMDILLPKMSGIECAARLRDLLPDAQMVILTGSHDNELVFLALEAGANGYLLKRTKPEDLRLALVGVLTGGAPMTSEIARRVVASLRKKAPSGAESVSLTAREEESLALLTQGYSNKEIAERLGLGIETVRSHLKHIYEKMDVCCRTEAVAHYINSRAIDAL
jgi:DNA-binding NarL/FixJ family response regulator